MCVHSHAPNKLHVKLDHVAGLLKETIIDKLMCQIVRVIYTAIINLLAMAILFSVNKFICIRVTIGNGISAI